MSANVDPIAIVGADGQLGAALCRLGKARGVPVVPIGRDVDVTRRKDLTKALSAARASVIVNAAAYTAVDKAESDQHQAFAVNRDAARELACFAEECHMSIVHISTDYVFDGSKAAPYAEDDPIAPLGIYGVSKAEGEAAVRDAAHDAVILRTAWVYGLEGNNFVKTMLRLGRERETLRVVNDQHGSPTFADDLAVAILAIIPKLQDGVWGTYHLAGQGSATWFELATEIFAIAGGGDRRVPTLEPISTEEYPTPARRPANSVLNCTKAKRTFAVELPHWKDGLARMLGAHLAAQAAP